MSRKRIRNYLKVETADSCNMRNGVVNKTKILVDIMWENYLNKCREDNKDRK